MKTPTPPPRTSHPAFWSWAILWLLVSSPLLVYLMLFQSSQAALLGLIGQSVLVSSLGLLRFKARPLAAGLLVALILLIAGGVLEQRLSRHAWLSSDKSGLLEGVTQLFRSEVSGVGLRSWSAASAERATLSFEARLARGQTGWDWFRSDSRIRVESLAENEAEGEKPFSRAYAPPTGAPYLMRTFDLGEPIGGKIFRVVLDLRDPNAPVKAGPRPELESGTPVGAQRCRGVALQAWSPGGGGRCLPVTLDGAWQRYSLSWRVPAGVESSVIRVLLSDFGGSTLDVRRVRLFTPRGELGPLMPQGAFLQVAWGKRPEAHSGYSFVPSETWEAHTLPLTRGDGSRARDTLSASVQTASGLSVETRHVQLLSPDRAALVPVSSARQTIFFGDPNLAGHTVAALGLALLSLASPLVASGGALLTVFGVALTGSRAAWLGLIVGVPWLLLLALPRRRRARAALLGLAGTFAVILALAGYQAAFQGGSQALTQGRLFSLYEVTARTDIWRAALEAFTLHPWRGLGEGGFLGYWSDTRGGEAVRHAHNLWLELASSYGLFGLLSALLLSAGLPYLAWRWGGARGLALVLAVFAMNVFDTTFFYAGVLFPLALALSALRTRTLEASGVPQTRPSIKPHAPAQDHPAPSHPAPSQAARGKAAPSKSVPSQSVLGKAERR